MAGIASWLQNAYLDWCLLGASPTRPTAIYIGLASAAPTASVSNELPATNGYARQSIIFPAASGGAVANTNAPSFGPLYNAIVIYGAQLWDNPTVGSGNMLWYGSFLVPREVPAAGILSFLPGSVTATLS